ncbi:V-type ATP synthase subunit A [Nitrosophilus alvini]|uniref:V-type ATP synthase subunit A n=1 Tax=Nitrosophilus alvini TaxID=2714855 RepID=UPI001909EDB1|nr:V-type ATP synthase subunit A [Nitrosophilus alvini]
MPYISYISGPVVRVSLDGEKASLYELAFVGEAGLIAEVVEVSKNEAVLQVYENSEGLKLKESVKFTGEMFCAHLGPGLLGSVFDGIQRPLDKIGEKIQKGLMLYSLDKERRWHFKPVKKVGDEVLPGECVGEVRERGLIHKIMLPSDTKGVIEYISCEGEYGIKEEILRLENGFSMSMVQKVPLRIPREFKSRESSYEPLLTGQRIIDFLFPVAKGGAASIPGGFGTGKTILQQTLAKWSDADVIVYVGCGERGNEMTEVLEEFPELSDPRSGKKLIDRTVLIANTSDMPVSARGASILLGLTIAEYYRDMGYHVALMADSTSRWAEAMREISGRMNELPAEEGFPAYLASSIAAIYERAGMVETLDSNRGSVTIIGAVSPPGGDLSEPVTRNTRRYTNAFWALDRELASSRFFPAINYNQSYSAYANILKEWWDRVDENASALREWMLWVLQKDSSLQKIVKLLGTEALPEEQKLLVETASLIKEIFLQQNAFDAIDAYSTPERIIKMAKIICTIQRVWQKCYKQRRIPVEVLKSQPVVSEFARAKFEIKNEELEKYDEIEQRVIKSFDKLIEEYGRK